MEQEITQSSAVVKFAQNIGKYKKGSTALLSSTELQDLKEHCKPKWNSYCVVDTVDPAQYVGKTYSMGFIERYLRAIGTWEYAHNFPAFEGITFFEVIGVHFDTLHNIIVLRLKANNNEIVRVKYLYFCRFRVQYQSEKALRLVERYGAKGKSGQGLLSQIDARSYKSYYELTMENITNIMAQLGGNVLESASIIPDSFKNPPNQLLLLLINP